MAIHVKVTFDEDNRENTIMLMRSTMLILTLFIVAMMRMTMSIGVGSEMSELE